MNNWAEIEYLARQNQEVLRREANLSVLRAGLDSPPLGAGPEPREESPLLPVPRRLIAAGLRWAADRLDAAGPKPAQA
jgi:hypothetical protein